MSLNTTNRSALEIRAERLNLFASTIITPEMRRSINISVDENPMDMHLAAMLVGAFMKKLVKNEVIVKEKSEEIIKGKDPIPTSYPARPVDSLIEFLLAYMGNFPRIYSWLLSKQRLVEQEPQVRVDTKIAEKIVHNHYHCIPWELNKSGYEARFLLWGDKEQFYEGTPEEWGDLKEIRDYINSAQLKQGNWSDTRHWARVCLMAHKSDMKKRYANE